MLFISGIFGMRDARQVHIVSISSSRCFSFQVQVSDCLCFDVQFQSRHRDAFHFRSPIKTAFDKVIEMFQSRHRDAFHFRRLGKLWEAHPNVFQSRHRDAFHFRCAVDIPPSYRTCFSFNLVIEMLFISGAARKLDTLLAINVSISSSRCFSFQVKLLTIEEARARYVSISSSRCFSFQERAARATSRAVKSFNLVIEMLFISGKGL